MSETEGRERTAAGRAAGYEVTALVRMLHGRDALLELPGEDEPVRYPWAGIAAETGIAQRDLPGSRLLLTVRETPEEGRVLSGFRLAGRM